MYFNQVKFLQGGLVYEEEGEGGEWAERGITEWEGGEMGWGSCGDGACRNLSFFSAAFPFLLCQVMSWHRSEKTHCRAEGLWRGKGICSVPPLDTVCAFSAAQAQQVGWRLDWAKKPCKKKGH